MTPIEVHKFGGRALRDATTLAAVVARLAETREAMAVVSAREGVTDALEEALRGPGPVGVPTPLLETEIRRTREEFEAPRADALAIAMSELARRADTPGALLALGEKWSALRLVAALEAAGRPARAILADRVLETEGPERAALPRGSEELVAAIRAAAERGAVPVLTGFCGRDAGGRTTVFPRGGSDLTATFAAAALGLREVTLWKLAEGICRADPDRVAGAAPVSEVALDEAELLARAGAGVVSPEALGPVRESGLTVRVRSLFRPEAAGTSITSDFSPPPGPRFLVLGDEGVLVIGRVASDRLRRRLDEALRRAGGELSAFEPIAGSPAHRVSARGLGLEHVLEVLHGALFAAEGDEPVGDW
ncbi:MAG: hypothetical protein R3F20_12420 [Planctomycetota bacterium]